MYGVHPIVLVVARLVPWSLAHLHAIFFERPPSPHPLPWAARAKIFEGRQNVEDSMAPWSAFLAPPVGRATGIRSAWQSGDDP